VRDRLRVIEERTAPHHFAKLFATRQQPADNEGRNRDGECAAEHGFVEDGEIHFYSVVRSVQK
jgi:hypothetical protein